MNSKNKSVLIAILMSFTSVYAVASEFFLDKDFQVNPTIATNVGYSTFQITEDGLYDAVFLSEEFQNIELDLQLFRGNITSVHAGTAQQPSLSELNILDENPILGKSLINNVELKSGEYTLASSSATLTVAEAISGVNPDGVAVEKEGVISIIVATSDFIHEGDSLNDIRNALFLQADRARSQQIIRQTNSEITQHLTSEIARAYGFVSKQSQNTLGASSDETESYLPDVFWGKGSYTNISEDGSSQNFVSDLYQFVGGFDKRFDDFYVGSALTYVYGDSRQSNASNRSNTVGITPYVAYKINDFIYASALAGYNYTHVDNKSNIKDADVHDYLGEFNLMGIYVLDSFIFNARAGVRYKHNFTSLANSFDADFDELTWIGDVELGYNYNESLSVYAGTLYEYRDSEDYSLSNFSATTPSRVVNSGVVHDGIVFVRAGLNYRVTSDLHMGLHASTEVTDEDSDIYTVGFNVLLEI